LHFGNGALASSPPYAVDVLLSPYERLVNIELNGAAVSLPENNTLLRGFQHSAPEDVSCGPFCWNQHCGTCVIEYDMGEGTRKQGALACELIVRDGMRIKTLKPIFGYCVRSLTTTNEPATAQECDAPWWDQVR
jgi:hypothetical protein